MSELITDSQFLSLRGVPEIRSNALSFGNGNNTKMGVPFLTSLLFNHFIACWKYSKSQFFLQFNYELYTHYFFTGA